MSQAGGRGSDNKSRAPRSQGSWLGVGGRGGRQGWGSGQSRELQDWERGTVALSLSV